MTDNKKQNENVNDEKSASERVANNTAIADDSNTSVVVDADGNKEGNADNRNKRENQETELAPEKMKAQEDTVFTDSKQGQPSIKSEQKTKHKRATQAETVDVAKANRGTRRMGAVFVSVIFIILCLAIIVGAYVTWYGNNLVAQQNGQIAQLQQQLTVAQSRTDKQLKQVRAEQSSSQQGLQQANNEMKQIIADLEQRLIAQNKRLRSMSTTSREDWLLAEAEYLLKLANQRVLIEKNAEGAAALLAEADTILRDLSDPDLFSIRREVKKDLAALRLTEKIDVEGIYLSLVALAGQVENLPINPTMQQQIEAMRPSNEERIKELSQLDDVPWYKRLGNGMSDFGDKLQGFFQVYHFEEKPTPLLPPEQASYLQQNLRMMIERAQLALLREQQDVYRQSLEQTKAWIKQYFPDSKKTQNFIHQIESIEQENIVRTLPDISSSLELLKGYIIDMHRVGDAKTDSRGQ